MEQRKERTWRLKTERERERGREVEEGSVWCIECLHKCILIYTQKEGGAKSMLVPITFTAIHSKGGSRVTALRQNCFIVAKMCSA